MKRRKNLAAIAITMCNPSSYIDENVKIGKGSKIWHFSHVQRNVQIGKECTLGQNVNIASNVKIGNFVKIQNNVSVYEGVELEDYVFCGPSMVFTNVLEPRSKYPQRGSEFYQATKVKEGASIGANATIICGNTIGKHSFIAAGAVVTKDVPDFALVMGVPAVQKAWVCECSEQLDCKKQKKAVNCSRCNSSYQLNQKGYLEQISIGSDLEDIRSTVGKKQPQGEAALA